MKVMNRLKKRIPVFLCVFCMFGGESSLWAQKHLVLDLNRTISLANDSSAGIIPYAEYVFIRLLGV